MFTQIRPVPARLCRVDRRHLPHIFVTWRSVPVCIADRNGVKMFEMAGRRQVLPVHVRVEMELHLFLTTALGAVEWTDSRPGLSNPGQCTVVPLNMRPGRPQGASLRLGGLQERTELRLIWPQKRPGLRPSESRKRLKVGGSQKRLRFGGSQNRP